MRIEMSMGIADDKFKVEGWWATKGDFVIHSLASQLDAAKVIFPELKRFELMEMRAPEPEPTPSAPAQAAAANG